VILGFDIPPAFDKDGSARMLRGTYAQVAAELKVPLLPSLLAGISDQPSLLQDDGIHPNAEAQARVLDNAWPTLRPLLLDSAAQANGTAASP
jgi:acyl-CoA thioesterase-1